MRYQVWQGCEASNGYQLSPEGTPPSEASTLILTFEAETWEDAKRISNAFISEQRQRELDARDVPRLRRIQERWSKLDEAILGCGLSDDVFIDPWESLQPNILAAWEALTKPENLADLEFWLASFDNGNNMNEWARKMTLKAIEVCRATLAAAEC